MPLQVGVTGSPNWVPIASNLLRRAGAETVEIWPDKKPRFYLRWLLSGAWRDLDLIYLCGGPTKWRKSLVFAVLPRPIAIHWLGSDILHYKSGQRKFHVINMLVRHKAEVHVTDSPELAHELGTMGIRADVVRLLSDKIIGPVQPLPPEPTVLSYTGSTNFEFYGGRLVYELARRFPDVRFRFIGPDSLPEPVPDNVENLGYVHDIEPVFTDATVLVRLPRHDSLAKMPLEMMSRGRYVIYNMHLEGAHFATDAESAAAALADVLGKTEPNLHGAEVVRTQFRIEDSVAMLQRRLHLQA